MRGSWLGWAFGALFAGIFLATDDTQIFAGIGEIMLVIIALTCGINAVFNLIEGKR